MSLLTYESLRAASRSCINTCSPHSAEEKNIPIKSTGSTVFSLTLVCSHVHYQNIKKHHLRLRPIKETFQHLDRLQCEKFNIWGEVKSSSLMDDPRPLSPIGNKKDLFFCGLSRHQCIVKDFLLCHFVSVSHISASGFQVFGLLSNPRLFFSSLFPQTSEAYLSFCTNPSSSETTDTYHDT